MRLVTFRRARKNRDRRRAVRAAALLGGAGLAGAGAGLLVARQTQRSYVKGLKSAQTAQMKTRYLQARERGLSMAQQLSRFSPVLGKRDTEAIIQDLGRTYKGTGRDYAKQVRAIYKTSNRRQKRWRQAGLAVTGAGIGLQAAATGLSSSSRLKKRSRRRRNRR